VDDIRNCWTVKFLPIFDEAALGKGEELWREKDDIELLEMVAEQEIEDNDNVLDFGQDMIDNGRTPEQNENRWFALLKGLGSAVAGPGKLFNPMQTALRLKQEILTKNERYVAF